MSFQAFLLGSTDGRNFNSTKFGFSLELWCPYQSSWKCQVVQTRF